MGRLTFKDQRDIWCVEGVNGVVSVHSGDGYVSGEPIDRLAAYEDTGLTPEEIMGLCEMDRRAKMANLLRLEEYQALGTIEELSTLVKARDEGRSQFANDAGGVLLHYIHEQRRLMRDIASAPDEPRKDIMYRHEADKLYMLESIAIDASHDMQRTVTYDRAEAEAALEGGKKL